MQVSVDVKVELKNEFLSLVVLLQLLCILFLEVGMETSVGQPKTRPEAELVTLGRPPGRLEEETSGGQSGGRNGVELWTSGGWLGGRTERPNRSGGGPGDRTEQLNRSRGQLGAWWRRRTLFGGLGRRPLARLGTRTEV